MIPVMREGAGGEFHELSSTAIVLGASKNPSHTTGLTEVTEQVLLVREVVGPLG